MSGERTLQTSRVLPYSGEQIYAAFADADTLASWWGPSGFTNSFNLFEFKTGGRWDFVMHGPDGTDYHNISKFQQLVPGEKVVIEHDCHPYFVLTISLTPAGDGGTLLHWQQVFESAEVAQAVAKIAGPANEQNIDKLQQAIQSRL